MKIIDADTIEMGKYYLMYFNQNHESKVVYIGKTLSYDKDFGSLKLIAYYDYHAKYGDFLDSLNTNEREIEIFYNTKDDSTESSIFELTDDEILMHIVREQL